MRDQAGLDSFLQELYDPSSPSYRHFLTVEQFTERFGPSQEDYDAVVDFAKANGFTVVGGSRDAMDVQLKGSVATIETAFHVTMGVYQHPTETAHFMPRTASPRWTCRSSCGTSRVWIIIRSRIPHSCADTRV